MIIDKNGRVLGKINIIDLLAILLILALFAALGTKFLLPKADEETIYLKFLVPEAEDWVVENIKPGAALYDKESDTRLGQVTRVETGTPLAWALTADGTYVPSSRDGFCSLTIYGSTIGVKEENGVEIGGSHYAVGQSVHLCAGDAELPARVRDIHVLSAENP